MDPVRRTRCVGIGTALTFVCHSILGAAQNLHSINAMLLLGADLRRGTTTSRRLLSSGYTQYDFSVLMLVVDNFHA